MADIPESSQPPLISVIILNYNGMNWLEKCLDSLRAQTIFNAIEVIVADNHSPDGSADLAARILGNWKNGVVIQHGANLGFCEGNNRATKRARGKYFLFLNNDTWLEPECLGQVLNTVETMAANAATPLMLEYADDTVQSAGGAGFDIFGLLSLGKRSDAPKQIFVAGGCSYLIARDLFERLGGFDSRFFMYAEEYDLSWRVWASGGSIVLVPQAHVHHRGAASINPKGEHKLVEIRTSDTKRFYTNRNCLLLLLKNCQHVLLVLVPLQLLLLMAEALVALVVFRRPSFIKKAYFDAILECWRLRGHILTERARMRRLRRRSDWQLLKFFRLRLNRYDELLNIRRFGMPEVAEK